MHFCLAYMLAVPVLEFPLLPPPQERNTGYWKVPGANLVIRVERGLVEVWGHNVCRTLDAEYFLSLSAMHCALRS